MKTKMKGTLDFPVVKISHDIPDLSNDDVLLAKKKRAIEFLKKNPIPENITGKSKNNINN